MTHQMRRQRVIEPALVLAIVLSMLTPATSYAESTNRNEVRAGLAEGGWQVIYGDLINEADYALFILAVASAVACECPAPIYEYFDDQLQAQITKIEATAPEIGEDALIDLLIAAFDSDGEVLRHGRLEVSGGLATYSRWETVIYDEPRTKTCWTKGIIKTKYPCVTMERVERKIPLPNNFQPYFRFRWTSSQPGSGSSSDEQDYDRIYFKNNCARTIWTALHYKNLDGQWVTDGWWKLQPGGSAFVAKTRNINLYIYAESDDPAESRLYWQGSDLHKSVRNSEQVYGFIHKTITTQDWGTWTESFTCN